jgi:glucokinase
MNYLGIEIGGTKLQFITGDESLEIRERRRLTVDRHKGGAGIRDQMQEAIPELFKAWRPTAIGVGFGGPVDWRTGRIFRSHQIEGWSGFELGAWLHSLTGAPARVDNDANMGALGESMRGAGVGFNPVFYVTLGSGVGGGLVVDGRIYHGAKPGESELGHLRLDRQGTIVEARCSGWAVDEKIRRLKANDSSSLLGGLTRNAVGGEAKFLSQALQANDPAARHILEETAEDLAFALSHAVHLFHPAVIVLGGGLSLVGEPLRAAVAKALPAFVMEVFEGGPQILLAKLGEDSVPVGCLVAASQMAREQS